MSVEREGRKKNEEEEEEEAGSRFNDLDLFNQQKKVNEMICFINHILMTEISSTILQRNESFY